MVRHAEHALRQVREIEDALARIVEGEPSAFEVLPPAVASVLGARAALATSFQPTTIGVRVERASPLNLPGFVDAATGYLRDKPVGWSTYNPLRPEPRQRNIVLSAEQVSRLAGLTNVLEIPIYRDVYRPLGLAAYDHLRVLVCEGASLLAWLGGWREEPFGAQERRILQRLVPAIRRRLVAERRLASEPSTRALFLASFAAISAPAFVTDASGALLEANAPGERWLAREGRAGREELRRAVRRGRQPTSAPVLAPPRWSVTRVVAAGCAERRLVVLTPDAEESGSLRAAAAASRWTLSPRQEAVLALVVQGISNRTIAAELAVSERAVEAHLTRLFERAQVESRAELVAAVWRLTG